MDIQRAFMEELNILLCLKQRGGYFSLGTDTFTVITVGFSSIILVICLNCVHSFQLPSFVQRILIRNEEHLTLL